MSISSIIKTALYTLIAVFFISCKSSVFCSGVCNGGTKGIGSITTKSISVSTFKAIDIESGSYDVVVNYSQTQDIKISAYENIIPMINFRVKGSTLIISSNSLYSTDQKIKISISVSALEEISTEGAIDLTVAGINGKRFEIDAEGLLDATLLGNIDLFIIDADGTSSINAKDLIAKNVKVKVDGVSEVVVYATDLLDAFVDGSGSVQYYGNPAKVLKKVDGVGSIEKL